MLKEEYLSLLKNPLAPEHKVDKVRKDFLAVNQVLMQKRLNSGEFSV